MHKTEKRIVDWIIKNIDLIVFIILTVVALLLRYYGRSFISDDMKEYFIPWFNKIKSNGGIFALSKQVGDYNVLYQTIIALMTYIDAYSVYMYKFLSIGFDFALAFMAAKLTCFIKKEKIFSFTFNVVYGLVLCIPVFIFNSGFWGTV